MVERPIVSSQPERGAENDELRLVTRTAVGDREAFRELYVRYRGPLFSLAVRMVGNVGEAEELLQDAFVKMWRAAPAYAADKSRPFTWAVTIMRRTCIDHLRRRAARGRVSATTDFVAEITTATPSTAAVAHEDTARLHAALAQMAEKPRMALELALFSGLTHAEIAGQLHEPLGTVKTWIRRGLLELRAALSPVRL